jgi:RNA polymerase sigma factor (sigma-70 family)
MSRPATASSYDASYASGESLSSLAAAINSLPKGPTAAAPSDEVPEETYNEWITLVDRIQRGEIDGMAELYQLFSKGIRFYLCRQLGPQELDDKVHDTFLVVVQAIRRGELREPQRLMGFVRTVVRRQVAAHIDKVVHDRRDQAEIDSNLKVIDPRENPEESAIFEQRNELIRRVLEELSARDREILTRFYLHEQSQERICADMSLTDTQFRLLKSRAKARFGEMGRRKLVQKSVETINLKISG